MFKPEFPYKGDQVIISSGRVTAHSKDDFIMLFGKKGVALSTPYSVNIDASERVLISSGRIELGYRASFEGSPVLLGVPTAFQLGQLLDALKDLGEALGNLSESNLAGAVPQIKSAADSLAGLAPIVKTQLNTTCLSDVTYTR